MVDLAPPRLRANDDVAERLEEVARLLDEQEANRFRVAAWRRGAEVVRGLGEPVAALLERGGREALEALPGIGESLARAIEEVVRHGRLGLLERLRGESDPVALFATVPGIGPVLAERVHDDLGVETLPDLELAAHDGRLAGVAGFGGQRVAGVRDALAGRLARVRVPAGPPLRPPPLGMLLEVDAEYRRRARAGTLPRIAPRRFNPSGAAWLPVLHVARGSWQFTALFSNTARAHQLHRTDDWVVIYWEGRGPAGLATVVTAREGPLRGRRVVRGREPECHRHYGVAARADTAEPTP